LIQTPTEHIKKPAIQEVCKNTKLANISNTNLYEADHKQMKCAFGFGEKRFKWQTGSSALETIELKGRSSKHVNTSNFKNKEVEAFKHQWTDNK
jgi:hypothetical protein